jgi:hypothetical protein
MSIDLDVFVVRIPKDLRSRWQEAFAEQGMICEFRPDFDPATWTAEDFVARMQVRRNGFPGAKRYGTEPFVTGCGMHLWRTPEFDEERDDLLTRCPKAMRAKLKKAEQKYFFTTSAGRSIDAIRFQFFAAATLALVTGGLFYSPQTALFNTGAEAVELAVRETTDWEEKNAASLKPGTGWKLRPFRTWAVALKDALPEYTGP